MLGNPFEVAGKWYKSALHVHTTNSDGVLSPAEAVKFYARLGFELICITDHSGYEPLSQPAADITVLPGVEVGKDRFHIVALGVDRPGRYESPEHIEELFARARKGEIALIMAHPYWCHLDLADTMSLDTIAAVEVFNATCENRNGRGFSDVHWDQMLNAGRGIWAIAVDDTHDPTIEGAYGWTMLKLGEPTREALVEAVLNGHCYASTGVTIHNLAIEDRRMHVLCDPVLRIGFITGPAAGGGRMRYNVIGPGLYEASFELPESYSGWVRAHCLAADGRRAWTNAFKCEGGRFVEWPCRPHEWQA